MLVAIVSGDFAVEDRGSSASKCNVLLCFLDCAPDENAGLVRGAGSRGAGSSGRGEVTRRPCTSARRAQRKRVLLGSWGTVSRCCVVLCLLTNIT